MSKVLWLLSFKKVTPRGERIGIADMNIAWQVCEEINITPRSGTEKN